MLLTVLSRSFQREIRSFGIRKRIDSGRLFDRFTLRELKKALETSLYSVVDVLKPLKMHLTRQVDIGQLPGRSGKKWHVGGILAEVSLK